MCALHQLPLHEVAVERYDGVDLEVSISHTDGCDTKTDVRRNLPQTDQCNRAETNRGGKSARIRIREAQCTIWSCGLRMRNAAQREADRFRTSFRGQPEPYEDGSGPHSHPCCRCSLHHTSTAAIGYELFIP